jgi:hypothetical protein
MHYLKNIGLAGMLTAAAALAPVTTASTAQAAPGIMAQGAAMADLQKNSATVQKVDRRGRGWKGRHGRRHGRRGHRRHDNDWNPGVAIGLGILGALIAEGHSESYARSAMQRCDDRFRSFEWDTGEYTTYGGEKRLCPYLR